MISYKVSDIKKLVKESIDELTKNGVQVNPQTVNIANPNTKAKSNDTILKPVCSSAFYSKPDDKGQEYLTVRLGQIHDTHKSILQDLWKQKYGQIFHAASNNSQRWGKAAAPFDLIVFPGQEEAFEQIVPDIVQDIADQNGKKGMTYNSNYLNNLQVSILGRLADAPSESDMEKADERSAQNIQTIISKLSDPDFLKSLGFVGGVSINSKSDLKDIIAQGNSTAWRISPTNQLRVKMYLPNATFVTNAWTWDHVFNRNVIDASLFALETKSANDKPVDVNSRIQAAAKLGYYDKSNPSKNPWDVYKSIRKDLSPMQQAAVEFLANMLNPHEAHFITQKVYDISNTELKKDTGSPDAFGKMGDGTYMFDRFNEEVNFLDNIQGIPNAKAQAFLNKSDDSNVVQGTQQPITWTPKSDSEIGDVINILRGICLKYCNTSPNERPGHSLGDTIADFAEFYCEHYICPRRGIVKNNIKESTCHTFAVLFAALFGFAVQRNSADMTGAVNNPDFKVTANALSEDFLDLVSKVNVELLKLSHSRVTANKKSATKSGQQMKSVMEEEVDKSFNREKIKQDFIQLFMNGGGNTSITEDCSDEFSQEQIQEEFFRMLDKLEHING